MTPDPVRDYYARDPENEWRRLTEPKDGALEYALTCQMLAKYLPAGGNVLDIGGGPGRYTIWLAHLGYRVTLADLSPELLGEARARIRAAGVASQVEAVRQADARDLRDWPAAAFDAVVCLGPFYHLPEPDDRERAASELIRVLRPEGVAFVALMSRAALLRRTVLVPDERRHLRDPAWLARLLEEGRFDNDVPGRFPYAYGARAREIAPFFTRHGLTTLALLGAEGVLAWLGGAIEELAAADPEAYNAALTASTQLADEPEALGLSGHILYIGQRPRP